MPPGDREVPPQLTVMEDERLPSDEVLPSTERSREVNQAADNLVFQTVIFQGFIMEFSLPENRAAFLRGEICPSSHGEALLGSLDAIRNMMLPTLRTGTHGLLRDDYAIAAVNFFTGLVDKSDEKPRDVPVRGSFSSVGEDFLIVGAALSVGCAILLASPSKS